MQQATWSRSPGPPQPHFQVTAVSRVAQMAHGLRQTFLESVAVVNNLAVTLPYILGPTTRSSGRAFGTAMLRNFFLKASSALSCIDEVLQQHTLHLSPCAEDHDTAFDALLSCVELAHACLACDYTECVPAVIRLKVWEKLVAVVLTTVDQAEVCEPHSFRILASTIARSQRVCDIAASNVDGAHVHPMLRLFSVIATLRRASLRFLLEKVLPCHRDGLEHWPFAVILLSVGLRMQRGIVEAARTGLPVSEDVLGVLREDIAPSAGLFQHWLEVCCVPHFAPQLFGALVQHSVVLSESSGHGSEMVLAGERRLASTALGVAAMYATRREWNTPAENAASLAVLATVPQICLRQWRRSIVQVGCPRVGACRLLDPVECLSAHVERAERNSSVFATTIAGGWVAVELRKSSNLDATAEQAVSNDNWADSFQNIRESQRTTAATASWMATALLTLQRRVSVQEQAVIVLCLLLGLVPALRIIGSRGDGLWRELQLLLQQTCASLVGPHDPNSMIVHPQPTRVRIPWRVALISTLSTQGSTLWGPGALQWTLSLFVLVLSTLRDELCSIGAASEVVLREQMQSSRNPHAATAALNWYFRGTAAADHGPQHVDSRVILQWFVTCVRASDWFSVQAKSDIVAALHHVVTLQHHAAQAWLTSVDADSSDTAAQWRRRTLKLYFTAAWDHSLTLLTSLSLIQFLSSQDVNACSLPCAQIIGSLVRVDLGFDAEKAPAWRETILACMRVGGPRAVSLLLEDQAAHLRRSSSGTLQYLNEVVLKAVLAQVDHFLRTFFGYRFQLSSLLHWRHLFESLHNFLSTLVLTNQDISDEVRTMGHHLCHYVCFDMADNDGAGDVVAAMDSLVKSGTTDAVEANLGITKFRENFFMVCASLFPSCGMRQWFPAVLGRVLSQTTSPLPNLLQLQLPGQTATQAALVRERRIAANALFAIQSVCAAIVRTFIDPQQRAPAISVLVRLHHLMNSAARDSDNGHNSGLADPGLGSTPPAPVALLLLLCECFRTIKASILPRGFSLFTHIVLQIEGPEDGVTIPWFCVTEEDRRTWEHGHNHIGPATMSPASLRDGPHGTSGAPSVSSAILGFWNYMRGTRAEHGAPPASPSGSHEPRARFPQSLLDLRSGVLSFVFDTIAGGTDLSMPLPNRHILFDCYVRESRPQPRRVSPPVRRSTCATHPMLLTFGFRLQHRQHWQILTSGRTKARSSRLETIHRASWGCPTKLDCEPRNLFSTILFNQILFILCQFCNVECYYSDMCTVVLLLLLLLLLLLIVC